MSNDRTQGPVRRQLRMRYSFGRARLSLTAQLKANGTLWTGLLTRPQARPKVSTRRHIDSGSGHLEARETCGRCSGTVRRPTHNRGQETDPQPCRPTTVSGDRLTTVWTHNRAGSHSSSAAFASKINIHQSTIIARFCRPQFGDNTLVESWHRHLLPRKLPLHAFVADFSMPGDELAFQCRKSGWFTC